MLDALTKLILVFDEAGHAALAFGTLLPVHGLNVRRDLTLLAGKFVGAPRRILGRLLRLLRTALVEQPLRLLQTLGGLTRLRPAIGAVGRRLPHRIRRVLQPAGRIRQILTLLSLPFGFTSKLFELARGLFDFIGQRALPGGSGRAALLSTQTGGLLGLFELAPRQFPQAVRQLVHFL